MKKLNRKQKGALTAVIGSVAGAFSVPVLSDPTASGALVELVAAIGSYWF